MSIVHEIALRGRSFDWETWRCTARWCREDRLHLARPVPDENTWLVYERPGWVIAASTPICPACASTLTPETAPSRATPAAAGLQPAATSRVRPEPFPST